MAVNPRRRPGVSALLAAAATAALVAGCSASGGSEESLLDAAQTGSSEGQHPAGPVAPALGAGDADTGAEGQDDAAADEGAEDRSGEAPATVPEGRMIARDASVAIEVEDVLRGASRVRAVAASHDGFVVQEEVRPPHADEEGAARGYATIVVSVPTARLDAALEQLEPLGEVTERAMTSADVTADYVDTTARIETLEASVERVRALMAEATSIADVVALEADLSRREADLDALKAHAQSLEGDVSRSTITVSLVEPVAAPEVLAEGPGGFTDGLRQGWAAFRSAAEAALTVLGAMLPFTAAAALVAAPVWLLRRRSRTA